MVHAVIYDYQSRLVERDRESVEPATNGCALAAQPSGTELILLIDQCWSNVT